MIDDNRKGNKALPGNASRYLNEAQQDQLRVIEGFGWSLKFIRRPLFQDPIPIVMSPDGGSIGVLETDGRLNLDANIEIRP